MYSLDIARLGWVSWQDHVQIPITKLIWSSVTEYFTARGYMVEMQTPGPGTPQHAQGTQPPCANDS